MRARDGALGRVVDVLFDDRSWDVRYVVVETSRWLPGRRVIVPRDDLGSPDWRISSLEVDLSREEIESRPGIESDPPVSLGTPSRRYRSYLWASYAWGGFVGGAAAPGVRLLPTDDARPTTHVRSMDEIEGYRIAARDGPIGHVEDFLLARGEWTVERLVIDTRNWLPGRNVVVPPSSVSRMDWKQCEVHVTATRAEIEAAPEVSGLSSLLGPRLLTIE